MCLLGFFFFLNFVLDGTSFLLSLHVCSSVASLHGTLEVTNVEEAMDCVVKARPPYAGIDGLLMKKKMVLCVSCWQPVAQVLS